MSGVPVIALDGPGGVGKGTVGRAVAAHLGWHYLDSGALYRAVGLAALRAGLSGTQSGRIAALVPRLAIACEGETIRLDGEDVSAAIRSEEAGRMASAIAAAPAVRAALIDRQRAFRQPPGLVADGRDMGTVVFPDARLKIFLVASLEERARRRHKQLKEQGINVKISQLESELRARDERDRRRRAAPLRAADDAVTVDTTAHPVDWVVTEVLSLAREAVGSGDGSRMAKDRHRARQD